MNKKLKICCCLNMNAEDPAGIGTEDIKRFARLGYDYVELPLAQLMTLSETEFEEICETLKKEKICCRACNNFFPAAVRITGPDVKEKQIEDYAKKAIKRAEKLGAQRIVFGSSGAKNVPENFQKERAFAQIVLTLQHIDDWLGKSEMLIAIEPLSKKESNIINTLAEGAELVNAVDRPHIQLLVDLYHLKAENESFAEIEKYQKILCHAHLANPEGRVFPSSLDQADYRGFFEKIKGAEQLETISIEAYTEDKEESAKTALALLKTL